jgi:hypothetical protein
MPKIAPARLSIALYTLTQFGVACAPANRNTSPSVAHGKESVANDPSDWGACQNIVVPAGVVIGKQHLLQSPSVAPRCLPSGAALSRTLNLLQTSTPYRRHRVRILYYGQSITRDAGNAPEEWYRKVTKWLEHRYPNADIETQMLAVGGFDAKAMQGPSRMDLPAFYPDLILWQNYGKYPDKADTLQWWRENTTAEIGIHNWHCGGLEKQLNSNKSIERMAYVYIPDLAKRFGAELIDLRTPWRKRWNEQNTESKQLTSDGVHLGPVGSQWYAEFNEAYLNHDPKVPVDPLQMVKTLVVGRDVQWNGKTLTVPFQGNRIEVLAQPGTNSPFATAVIRIDGKKPSQFAEAYVFSRPNDAVDHDWPWQTASPSAIDSAAPRLLEDWTLTIESIDYPNKRSAVACTFSVSGSLTQKDGVGSCDRRFVSNSGRVVIDPSAWAHLWDAKHANAKTTLSRGAQFHWKVLPLHSDTYPTVNSNPTDPAHEHWTLLASGISNTNHTLTLTATGDMAPPIAEVRVYRPPLGR